ncbi:hypothetical protein QE152_g5389 [Popillia japonica]|uniref:Uncharacterized protein n=1 Tax=Popillia japonica TaxID=7064 RepID=A0AAW1MNP2_POPJA
MISWPVCNLRWYQAVEPKIKRNAMISWPVCNLRWYQAVEPKIKRGKHIKDRIKDHKTPLMDDIFSDISRAVRDATGFSKQRSYVGCEKDGLNTLPVRTTQPQIRLSNSMEIIILATAEWE